MTPLSVETPHGLFTRQTGRLYTHVNVWRSTALTRQPDGSMQEQDGDAYATWHLSLNNARTAGCQNKRHVYLGTYPVSGEPK